MAEIEGIDTPAAAPDVAVRGNSELAANDNDAQPASKKRSRVFFDIGQCARYSAR